MKKIFIYFTCIIVVLLSACGNNNKYDDVINEVLRDVNEGQELLSTSSVFGEDINTNIKREDCDFYVFEDGKYIAVYFKLEKEDETKVDGLYKLNADGEYEEVFEQNEDYDKSNPNYIEKEGEIQ